MIYLRIEKVEGIIIKEKPYGESSKILDISNGIVNYDLIDREEKLIGECEK